MRVRILQSIAGPNFSWAPGDLVELDAKAAALWADGVRAELAEDTEPAGAEKAAARSRGGGRARRTETR